MVAKNRKTKKTKKTKKKKNLTPIGETKTRKTTVRSSAV
jgi:hypothetical protein